MYNFKNIFLTTLILLSSTNITNANISTSNEPDLDSSITLRCNENEYAFQDYVLTTIAQSPLIKGRVYVGAMAVKLSETINMGGDGVTAVPQFSEAVVFTAEGAVMAYIGLSRDGCVFATLQVLRSEYDKVERYMEQFVPKN